MFSFLYYTIPHNTLSGRKTSVMDWYLLLPLLPRPLCLVPHPLAVPTPHLKDPGTPPSINLWDPFVVCFLLSLLVIKLPYAQLLVTFKQPLYYSAFCHLWQSMEWMNYFSWTLQLFWPDMLNVNHLLPIYLDFEGQNCSLWWAHAVIMSSSADQP